ncbi:MAG: isocitrate lyase/phosphoenolpyruvate mutase family protein [Pseudonocardiaceae bacterium]
MHRGQPLPPAQQPLPGPVEAELIAPDEQARRIRAGKAAQETDSFVFIARVEALIAGHGVAAACERAEAYVDAGADAILVHSKDKSLQEIEGFLGAWAGRGTTPLVAVPTLFPDYTDRELFDKGFQMVILANHPMRAAVQAMEHTLETLSTERKAAAVDPHIASVDHIFELVRTKEAIALEESGG